MLISNFTIDHHNLMLSSKENNNWIQFQGDKLSLIDFIQKYKNEQNGLLNTVIEFIKDWESDSSHILQKTSGSTGKPKTIKILKNQIKESALATLNTLEIKRWKSCFAVY